MLKVGRDLLRDEQRELRGLRGLPCVHGSHAFWRGVGRWVERCALSCETPKIKILAIGQKYGGSEGVTVEVWG